MICSDLRRSGRPGRKCSAIHHTLSNHIKYGRSINRSRNKLKHLQIREKPKQNTASIVDLLENRNLEILSQKRGIVIESSQRSLPAYSLGPMQSEYNKLVRLIAVTVRGPANVNKTQASGDRECPTCLQRHLSKILKYFIGYRCLTVTLTLTLKIRENKTTPE